jgi:hypothetical protein
MNGLKNSRNTVMEKTDIRPVTSNTISDFGIKYPSRINYLDKLRNRSVRSV